MVQIVRRSLASLILPPPYLLFQLAPVPSYKWLHLLPSHLHHILCSSQHQCPVTSDAIFYHLTSIMSSVPASTSAQLQVTPSSTISPPSYPLFQPAPVPSYKWRHLLPSHLHHILCSSQHQCPATSDSIFYHLTSIMSSVPASTSAQLQVTPSSPISPPPYPLFQPAPVPSYKWRHLLPSHLHHILCSSQHQCPVTSDSIFYHLTSIMSSVPASTSAQLQVIPSSTISPPSCPLFQPAPVPSYKWRHLLPSHLHHVLCSSQHQCPATSDSIFYHLTSIISFVPASTSAQLQVAPSSTISPPPYPLFQPAPVPSYKWLHLLPSHLQHILCSSQHQCPVTSDAIFSHLTSTISSVPASTSAQLQVTPSSTISPPSCPLFQPAPVPSYRWRHLLPSHLHHILCSSQHQCPVTSDAIFYHLTSIIYSVPASTSAQLQVAPSSTISPPSYTLFQPAPVPSYKWRHLLPSHLHHILCSSQHQCPVTGDSIFSHLTSIISYVPASTSAQLQVTPSSPISPPSCPLFQPAPVPSYKWRHLLPSHLHHVLCSSQHQCPATSDAIFYHLTSIMSSVPASTSAQLQVTPSSTISPPSCPLFQPAPVPSYKWRHLLPSHLHHVLCSSQHQCPATSDAIFYHLTSIMSFVPASTSAQLQVTPSSTISPPPYPLFQPAPVPSYKWLHLLPSHLHHVLCSSQHQCPVTSDSIF